MPTPFSFGPPPSAGKGPQNIAEFIARANLLPGGFRGLNQAELKKQIAAEKDGASVDKEDEKMADADADEGDVSKEEEDLIKNSRNEMAQAADAAHQSAMITLDFISLLLSKEHPVQATATLSQQLRAMVGVGTLGATRLDAPSSVTLDQIGDHKMITIGRRLVDLESASDASLTWAAKHRQEIALESKYWGELVGVSESGWPMLRLPEEPHNMGVKFGFSSASALFRANSMAPIRRAADGSARLDCGKMGCDSMRLQVCIVETGRKGGGVVGKSSLPKAITEHASLERRVLEARNSIFARELWHELNREGRRMMSFGVRLGTNTIEMRLNDARKACFSLVELEAERAEAGSVPVERSTDDDDLAESLNTIVHILLSRAHKTNNWARSAQGILITGQQKNQEYELLRPITTHIMHEEKLQNCIAFFSNFTATLRLAGLASASCTMTEAPILPVPAPSQAESLMRAILKPSRAQFDLTITAECRIRILAQTTLEQRTRCLIRLLPPPPTPKQQKPSVEQNPLFQLFPPDPETDNSAAYIAAVSPDVQFRTPLEMFEYLGNAVPRVLAVQYLNRARQLQGLAGEKVEELATWALLPNGKAVAIDSVKNKGYAMCFDYHVSGHGKMEQELCVVWEERPAECAGGLLPTEMANDKAFAVSKWTWRRSGGREDQSSLDEVVMERLRNVMAG